MDDPKPGPADKNQRPREPRADEVVAQLERILAQSEFAKSARLRTFLRFIVEETLAGRGGMLKEYTIALEVFDRDDSFDPQTSSIVRVEASRLRAKLERFNAVEGRNDPVRIDLPAGGYLPEFRATGRGCEPTGRQSGAAPIGGAPRKGLGRAAVPFAVAVAAAGAAALFAADRVSFRSDAEPTLEASRPAESFSLAVLPLRDLSDGGTEAYFSDGMTDALTTRLARVGPIRVTSVTSVLQYRNVDRPMADIARELGVSHVIEGSVLRIGDRVRITAQLIEAAPDRQVWADSYERNFADLLTLQDEVAERIVASLPGQVGSAGDLVATEPTEIDPAAYEAHLRGRYFLNQMTEEGFRNGIASFEQAIEKQPDFAPAYSGMASCYCLLGGHGFEIVKPSEGMPAARDAVLEALRLDATLADAHAFLGIIRLKYDWDWPGAEEAFTRSIALDPSYAQARIFHSFYLEAMGRQDAAIGEAETARANDPLSMAANVNLGWQYLQAGRLEQARQVFESVAELDPDFWGVHWGLGHYHRRRGDLGEAIAAFREAVAAGGGHAMPLSALGHAFAIAGQPVEARRMLDRLIALAEESYVSPFNMAVVHAGLGETDAAFAWLEMAYADRSRSMAWLDVTEELDGMRSDPRFASLLSRVGLPSARRPAP